MNYIYSSKKQFGLNYV